MLLYWIVYCAQRTELPPFAKTAKDGPPRNSPDACPPWGAPSFAASAKGGLSFVFSLWVPHPSPFLRRVGAFLGPDRPYRAAQLPESRRPWPYAVIPPALPALRNSKGVSWLGAPSFAASAKGGIKQRMGHPPSEGWVTRATPLPDNQRAPEFAASSNLFSQSLINRGTMSAMRLWLRSKISRALLRLTPKMSFVPSGCRIF